MSTVLTAVLVIIAIVAVIWLTSRLRINAFIALFTASLLLAASVIPAEKMITIMKDGFGSTMASIGFLIIFGAMIGVILDKTGATKSIAGFILSGTGRSRSAAALGVTGYITGLPIFCDSGFIVLSGLAKSFSRLSGLALPFMTTVLATSLYSVHCLIPPHPGATAAAGIIGADIGHLVLAGALVAIPGAISSFFWSKRMTAGGNYRAYEASDETAIPEQKNLPPVFLSFMPVVIPLFLITLRSIFSMFEGIKCSTAAGLVSVMGDPVTALFTGLLFALFLVKEKSVKSFNLLFSDAVVKAGPILIVTAAGGTFGMVIRSTGIGEAAGDILSGTGLGLVVPFVLAAILKTAQGSSTVAIITAASFVAPMMSSLGLDSGSGRLLTMLSMGAGSMIFSHANDSFFWVVSSFGGVESGANLKIFSSSTFVMGTVVFITIWVSSLFLL